MIRRASTYHDETAEEPGEHRHCDQRQSYRQPGRSIPNVDLAYPWWHPHTEHDITLQFARCSVDKRRPSRPMDDIGPRLNELRTFDGEPQSTIIDAVDDNVSIAGIGNRSNGSIDDRQSIGSNERAVTIGTDDTDNHHTVVVDAERRSAFLSEHPNGHGRLPHQDVAFDGDDHR